MIYSKNKAQNYLKLAGVSSLAILATLASTSVATAQTSEIIDNDDGSSEIIVTVERRAQSLQDYAGTAAAISGEELSLLGIDNFTEIDGKIPGLSIANNRGNIEVYIRGVGSSNNTELGDPAAATHLNGVYVPRPSGFGAAFFDIERVEVNIGPQGTLRGRNATAGSVDIIPWGPGIGSNDGGIEASYGNFNDYRVEGVANFSWGDDSAIRIAAFKGGHDSYLNNISPSSEELELDAGVPTSEDEGLGVAEATDDFGIRAAYRVKPSDALTLTVTGDYIEQKGTGYTGVNFALPLGEGVDPDDIDNPRDVFARGITPVEDTEHYGIKGHVEYDFGDFKAEYIGSYRDLVYDYEFTTPASPNFDGALEALRGDDGTFNETFDNFNRINFTTDSESQIHELRLFSDNDSKLDWTLGGFYFIEDQRTFLGTTGDRNPFFQGVEFNQTTATDSYSLYGDATYSVSDQFRVTGGLRYTKDEKQRFGINARYAFGVGGGPDFIDGGFSCCFTNSVAFGTEGFEFAGLDREIIIPDTNGDGEVDGPESIAFLFDGITQLGDRDGFDEIFPNGLAIGDDTVPDVTQRPLCDGVEFAFDGICDNTVPVFQGRIPFTVAPFQSTFAVQNGRLENDFVDWRLRGEYDFDDDHLVYGLVATGNKSGGFNDNIPDTQGLGIGNAARNAPAEFDTDTLAPTYGPETLTLYEIGSKNEFSIGDIGAKFNVSGFYYDYDDLQLTTLLQVQQAIEFEGIDPELIDLPEGTGNAVFGFTFNASDAEIYGAQFEGELDFPNGWNLDGTLLWLAEARVVNSQEIQDSRFQADIDEANATNRNIEGNRLVRTPEFQFNGSLSKAWNVDSGSVDGIVSLGYRSSQHMTIFNGIDFENPDNPEGRLDDRVDGYFTVDAGAGYSHGSDGKWRIEAYVNNLTDKEVEQAIIITQFDNTRFFSTPRTYGARVRAKF